MPEAVKIIPEEVIASRLAGRLVLDRAADSFSGQTEHVALGTRSESRRCRNSGTSPSCSGLEPRLQLPTLVARIRCRRLGLAGAASGAFPAA
jgi:hypothetical protein